VTETAPTDWPPRHDKHALTMEAQLQTLRSIAMAVRKHRWLTLGVAGLVAVAATIAIAFVPNRYVATARVYVDTETVLKPLMTGLTFQPDIDQQVRMLARNLVSRPNIERLVANPSLGFGGLNAGARDELVTRLTEQIKVAPTGEGNIYQVSYRGGSPEAARRIVAAIVDLFAHSGAGTKQRDSRDAGRFIEDQIHDYERKLTDAENRLKDFKVRNFGVSGVAHEDFFTRMSALTDEVNKLRLELGAATQSREAYQRQLTSEDPLLPPELVPKTVEPVAQDTPQVRLDAERKRLDELMNRYTDNHPDVIDSRRIIARLEAEVRRRSEAEERAREKLGKPGRAPTNPVYQRLRILIAESDARIASLRSQLAIKQEQLSQARAAAGRMPQVEAELSQLNRDYDVIRKNYDLMVARRESALIGMKLDESSQLAEFRVIDPPRASRWPAFPGRLHLALLALVLAPALGVTAAVLADRMRPTFDDARALRMLSGRPVLGTVSHLLTPQAQRHDRRQAWGFTGLALSIFVLQAAWAIWIAMHLPIK
jgi:polysaccharide chain length determinant protein (PEP-CTERM system associated)